MTWEGFYVTCFVVGFALAALGFLGGALHWQLPHGHGHGLSLRGVLGAHHASGPARAATPASSGHFAILMAFLAWFGGMGYLLSTRGNVGRLVVLAVALASGLAGAAIVFGFLTKVLLRNERSLDAADFDMNGVLGKVTVGIREGGTGEIVYSQEGTRRSTGARSESGLAIGRGAEVVVTRYERGIAYVRPWEEFSGEQA